MNVMRRLWNKRMTWLPGVIFVVALFVILVLVGGVDIPSLRYTF